MERNEMQAADMRQTKIIRLQAVKAWIGLSRSTIYLKISQGTFPKPISLGARAVGWVESEIAEWLAGRLQRRDETKS